jgi:hypothetical protein
MVLYHLNFFFHILEAQIPYPQNYRSSRPPTFCACKLVNLALVCEYVYPYHLGIHILSASFPSYFDSHAFSFSLNLCQNDTDVAASHPTALPIMALSPTSLVHELNYDTFWRPLLVLTSVSCRTVLQWTDINKNTINWNYFHVWSQYTFLLSTIE